MSSAELSGNAPSADQLRMSVTLQPIFDGRTPEQIGIDGVPAFLLIEQSHVRAAWLHSSSAHCLEGSMHFGTREEGPVRPSPS